MSSFNRRREVILALGAAPLLAATAGRAQAPSVPEAGTDFNVVPNPQPTDSPSKVEVLDFFWYGCPHCYAFLPELESWRKKLPADVDFRHVAVDFGSPAREVHTKIFYALQVLNRVDDMHVKVFDAFHLKHQPLNDRDAVADFMAANGIDRAKWLDMYNSFAVTTKTRAAYQTQINYNVEGTPTLAVDGKYLTAPSQVRTQTRAGAIYVLDYLVERARRERGSKSDSAMIIAMTRRGSSRLRCEK